MPLLATLLLFVAATGRAAWFERIGTVADPALDEISGIAALPDGDFVVHNDDGPGEIFVLAPQGRVRARIHITGAEQPDWEDVTLLPTADGPLLVLGDIGDNAGIRATVRLYFVSLPRRDRNGRYPAELPVRHTLRLRYPDGPRDAESLAYDADGARLLLISKRDLPPRIYAIDVTLALARTDATLQRLGDLTTLRPPTPWDLLRDPFRGAWASEPTGLDIAPDGHQAAIITYRSLYLFRRTDDEDWSAALQRKPVEVLGPPGADDEAVTFARPDNAVIVTTEGTPAPLYRLKRTDQSSATP